MNKYLQFTPFNVHYNGKTFNILYKRTEIFDQHFTEKINRSD